LAAYGAYLRSIPTANEQVLAPFLPACLPAIVFGRVRLMLIDGCVRDQVNQWEQPNACVVLNATSLSNSFFW
jgi:hypothetical protein